MLPFTPRPAVTRHGEQVFAGRCAKCHGVGDTGPGPGTPVAKWSTLQDPIELTYEMWDHAASMKKECSASGTWAKLEGDDFRNLSAYLQGVQKAPRHGAAPASSLENGKILTAQHCGSCHGGSNSFAASLPRNNTLTEIGAATWNHVPLLKAVPTVSPGDFREIVAYVWELQYRGPDGTASRGQQVFESKRCIACHRSPSAETPLSPRHGKAFTPYSMIALGWGSGREMHRQMEEKGVAWPTLSPDDVSDVVAFMNTLTRWPGKPFVELSPAGGQRVRRQGADRQPRRKTLS